MTGTTTNDYMCMSTAKLTMASDIKLVQFHHRSHRLLVLRELRAGSRGGHSCRQRRHRLTPNYTRGAATAALAAAASAASPADASRSQPGDRSRDGVRAFLSGWVGGSASLQPVHALVAVGDVQEKVLLVMLLWDRGQPTH